MAPGKISFKTYWVTIFK